MVSAPVVELEADVLERMQDYVAQLAAGFERITRHYWAGVYLHGLLLDGERKSIHPLAGRVRVPGWHGNTMPALQHFISDSPWDEQAVLPAYRHLLAASMADPAGVIVMDDTGFAKKGRFSVGVDRQYSGTLGKTDNCQVAVSLHSTAPHGDDPLALRRYLPESWTSQPERMQAARVPAQFQAPRTTEQIALDLLDQVRSEGLPQQAVVADAGDGRPVEFRRGREQRDARSSVGITGQAVVFVGPPNWVVPTTTQRGRPATRRSVAADTPPPPSVKQLAEPLERTPVRRRHGTKGGLHAAFAWVRGWPAHQWPHGRAAEDLPNAEAEARWLLVAGRTDGSSRSALSNLPAEPPLRQAVEWWKRRWHVAQGSQHLKEELGLDHFEGRAWPGFHQHVTMCCLAYGFLSLERRRGTPTVLDALNEEPARPCQA